MSPRTTIPKGVPKFYAQRINDDLNAMMNAITTDIVKDFECHEEVVRSWLLEYIKTHVGNGHGGIDAETQTEEGDIIVHPIPETPVVDKIKEVVVNPDSETYAVHHIPVVDKGKEVVVVLPTNGEGCSNSSTSMYSDVASKVPMTSPPKRAESVSSSTSSGSTVYRKTLKNFMQYDKDHEFSYLSEEFNREEILKFTRCGKDGRGPAPKPRGYWLDGMFVDISCMYGMYARLSYWSNVNNEDEITLSQSAIARNRVLFHKLFKWPVTKADAMAKGSKVKLNYDQKCKLSNVFGFMEEFFPDAPLFS